VGTGPRSFAFPVSLIAALACIILPSCGYAQSGGAVRGTVFDPGGQPLSGVVVAVQGLGLSVATSVTGRYVLPRVPAGQHVLQFRRIGYAPHQVTVDVATDTAFTADAVLDPQPIELGTVLVEGVSRVPDRMIDAPAAVEVVRPATAQPVSITGQVPLALVRVPGLDVAQGGVTDFNVNARGFNSMLSRKLLVLQDGRDLGTAVVGQQMWGALSEPLEDLGRIEVIRGPGSALYGANAYNGVINITTPAARDVVGTKLTLGGGELGTARADLRQAGEWFHDRLGYRVNLGYTRSDDWTRSRTSKDSADWKREYAPATATPPPSPKPDSLPLIGQTKDPVTGQALGTPDPLVTIYGSARVDYYAANGSIVTLESGTARVDNSVFLSGTGRNQSPRVLRPWARLAWDADGSGVSIWYSGASFSQVGLTTGTTLYDDESVFHLEGRTSRTFHGDAGRVVVGASVQDNTVNSQGTVLGPANDDRSDQYYGAFAQLEHSVGHVRLIAAVRWDDSDLFPAQLSPKGALVFTPAKNHALRLTVDRAFLTPSLVSLFGGRPASPGGVQNLSAIEAKLRADPAVSPALTAVGPGKLFDNSAAVPESAFGNPHLAPQTVMSYEVGYKGQFGRRVFITLDAYDAHVQNFTTGLLPAGTTGLNPDFKAWTAPNAVPAASRAAVEAAVLSALTPLGSTVKNGLTRLPDGTTAIVLSYGNVGSVDEWGVELGGSAALTNALTLSATYTWYNFAIRQNRLVGNVLAPNTPQHKGSVALAYAGRQGLDLGVDTRIVGGYPWSSGIWVGYVPASQIVNLNAGYRISPHFRVYANATDLFDQQRFQVYGGSVIGRRVLAGVTSTF
jgi:outer membrane receptor for ferrienterochelin and colicins